LPLTWGVAPGYYISRRWRLLADFCSKAVEGIFLDAPSGGEYDKDARLEKYLNGFAQ